MSTPTSTPTNDSATRDVEQRRSNQAVMKRLVVVVLGMFAFGFALVPFYEQICEATGLRNIAQADRVRNTQVDASRSIRIEFDSNLRKLPWTFKPLETVVNVHPGEMRQVIYEVVNTTDRAITGQAIPSYGPQHAAKYFQKLDCFCFAKQTMQPGETRRMPVVFAVAADIPADLAAITLSYTFFEVEGADGDKGSSADAAVKARPAAHPQGTSTRSDS